MTETKSVATALRRYALGVEYDGSRFCGWQSQLSGGSVQDAVEAALAKIADTSMIRVHCAGRTDSGVHALEQVIHFDTDVVRPDAAWVRGVNAHLPDAVAVRWAAVVPDDFHARFSAQARCYRYALLNRCSRPGLLNARVGWYHRPLNVEAMATAATQLLGKHDFSSFRAAECQAKSPVKTLHVLDVRRQGDLILFDVEADGFLQHMVRNLVGALIYVGNGKFPREWIGQLLAQHDRTHAAPTFSASGLYFMGARYDEKFGLPNVGADSTALFL